METQERGPRTALQVGSEEESAEETEAVEDQHGLVPAYRSNCISILPLEHIGLLVDSRRCQTLPHANALAFAVPSALKDSAPESDPNSAPWLAPYPSSLSLRVTFTEGKSFLHRHHIHSLMAPYLVAFIELFTIGCQDTSLMVVFFLLHLLLHSSLYLFFLFSPPLNVGVLQGSVLVPLTSLSTLPPLAISPRCTLSMCQ